RPPSWSHIANLDDSFPAVMVREPQAIASSMRDLADQNTFPGPYAFLETRINGTPYQLVGHRLVDPQAAEGVSGIIALGINLDWVRRHYFEPILNQISSIGDVNESVTFWVTDENNDVVATAGPSGLEMGPLQRGFPLLFLEPTALRAGLLPRPTVHDFTLRAR